MEHKTEVKFDDVVFTIVVHTASSHCRDDTKGPRKRHLEPPTPVYTW